MKREDRMWELFSQTGDIRIYGLYKQESVKKEKRGE